MPGKPRLVLIEWDDSRLAPAAWEHAEDLAALKPSRCMSVGFLLHDGKRYKTIAQSIGEGQVVGRMTIPAGCIRRVSTL